jgi:hypothetical protein
MLTRLEFVTHAPSAEEAAAILARSNDIQEQLWQKDNKSSGKQQRNGAGGLYMNTLNEMIDDQERRLTAIRNQVPLIVICALYGIALIAVTFTGYAVGLEKQFSRIPVCILGIVIAFLLLLIQDLNRPGEAFMRVSQQPILDTAASLEGYTDTNPPKSRESR